MSLFEKKLLAATLTFLFFSQVLFTETFIVDDTLAWIHATLDHEQKVKLLYIIDMGWLKMPEHNV